MKTILTLQLLLFASITFAQTAPAIEWQKSLGGSGDEEAHCIVQTSDGGYIVAGESDSNDGDITGNHGSFDYWIVKLDNTGSISWEKSLGGTGFDYAYSIAQTTDGGYVVAGYSNSNDGDVSGNHGGVDYWVVKLDSTGNITWQKSLGGSGDELATSIEQTRDGGYIVSGYTTSNDGDVTGYHGGIDYWVVRLDSAGNIIWQKALGGSNNEYAYAVEQTTDGGFILSGESYSTNGDVIGNQGKYDIWVLKLDSLGSISWQKSLGGSNNDLQHYNEHSIEQTSDGGYIVSGYSNSNDGDVTGNHGGSFDIWVAKLDSLGAVSWQKSLGGTGDEQAGPIRQTSDGGYIVTGQSPSTDGDVTGNHGNYDYWVVKLDTTGAISWQKSLGGSSEDLPYSIEQTSDGGYIVAGISYSIDGDVTGNHGADDYWVVKLGAEALPLRLLSFTGALQKNSVALQWQTASEENTKDFIVERSADLPAGQAGAAGFSAIGKVNAKDAPGITNTYHYTDDAPLRGINYYRLKMVDIDSIFTYSNVIAVKSDGVDFAIHVFPNPASNILNVQLPSAGKAYVKIYDASGKIVGQQEVVINGNTSKLDISQLIHGLYYLRITTNGNTQTIPFTKQ